MKKSEMVCPEKLQQRIIALSEEGKLEWEIVQWPTQWRAKTEHALIAIWATSKENGVPIFCSCYIKYARPWGMTYETTEGIFFQGPTPLLIPLLQKLERDEAKKTEEHRIMAKQRDQHMENLVAEELGL